MRFVAWTSVGFGGLISGLFFVEFLDLFGMFSTHCPR